MKDGTERNLQPRLLRIAYLLQQFPLPTETFAVSDIAALISQGHDVCVYTVKAPRPNEKELVARLGVPEGVRIARPTWAGARKWPLLLWQYRSAALMLLREILRAASSTPVAAFQALVCIPRILEIASDVKRRDSDVVHAFWARHVGLVLPVLRAERARALRSAFVGAYDLVSDDFLVDATAEAAQVIFSHAEANRAYLEKKAPRGSAIHIIRRGIPLPDLNDEAAREPFQWVTASSLIREKNVEAVLRAFAIAHRHDPRLKLKIFGDGPDRPRLERIARQLGCSDSATFAGHVRRDELFAEMQRASVFMLLSKGQWERLPNVIKEALWAGCAVISSNSTGIDELIPDDSVGYVVDPDNEASVNVAVTAVLDASDGERALSRRNARAHIARHFSTAASMRAYAEIWQSHCPPLAADPRPAWSEPSCDNAR